MLDNKLGIINEVELSKEEERLSKIKALKLFDIDLNNLKIGTFECLSSIHEYLLMKYIVLQEKLDK